LQNPKKKPFNSLITKQSVIQIISESLNLHKTPAPASWVLRNLSPRQVQGYITDGITIKAKSFNSLKTTQELIESKVLRRYALQNLNPVITNSLRIKAVAPAEFSNIFQEHGKQLMKAKLDLVFSMLTLTFVLLLSIWLHANL